MPRDALPQDHRDELVRKFRECADTLEADRDERFALLDVKYFLIAALNDCDRALSFGKPMPGLSHLMEERHNG